MSLRVSLQIDGDATGAEKAAVDTARAIEDLGKQSETVSKTIEDGFSRASGSVGSLANSSKALGAANDNVSSSTKGVVSLLDQVAQKTLGADNALSKLTSGASTVVKGLTSLGSAAGVVGLLGGVFGIVAAAATTFYSIVDTGGNRAEATLREQARLVDVVKGSYDEASKTAKNFFEQSANVTRLQIQQNLLQLKADRSTAVSGVVGDFDKRIAAYSVPEIDFNGKQKANPYQQEADNYRALQGAVENLRAALAAGSPDAKKFQDEIAAIGVAAEKTNPELAKEANGVLERSKAAADYTNKIERQEASLALLNGTATEQQKKLLGISTATQAVGNDYDRLVKSMQRQAAAQEAEALTVGKSAGETAKLRAEYLLIEAATQSGIKVQGDYAKQIDAIAGRFGTAAQKAAEYRLQSDTFFTAGQLGRSSTEATVADQLRGVYGDNVDGALNGAAAGAIRFNEQMKDLKSTTIGLSQSFKNDFVSSIQSGENAFTALGKSGVNAISNILGKLSDKALDVGISKLFGAFAGGGGIASGLGLFGGSIIPGILHGGGMGADAPSSGRSISVGYFTNAPRFHSGKLPWDTSTELPAIIRKDEEVGYPWRLAQKYGGGGRAAAAPPQINQSFYITGNTGEELRAATQDAVQQATRTAIAYTDGSLKNFSDNALPSRLTDIQDRML